MEPSQYNNNDQYVQQNTYYDQFGQVRELLQQEVIAKSFLYMVAALAVTAIAAFTAPDLLAGWLARGRYNILILFGAMYTEPLFS